MVLDEMVKANFNNKVKEVRADKDTFLYKATFYSKVLKTESAISEMKLDEFYISSSVKKNDKKKYKYWQMKMAYNNLEGKLALFSCLLGRGDTIDINNLSNKRKEYIHNRWIEFKDKQGIDIRKIKHKLELCEIILD